MEVLETKEKPAAPCAEMKKKKRKKKERKEGIKVGERSQDQEAAKKRLRSTPPICSNSVGNTG